jgi:hypothetical protein
MRVANAAILLITIGCIVLETSHAQGHNIFQAEDSRRIDEIHKKVFDTSEELSKHVDYSLSSPPIDEHCRRTLDKSVSNVFKSISWVEALVSISSQMTSRVDEAVVNRRLKSALSRGLFTLKTCAGMAKSVTRTPTCDSNEYIIEKAKAVAELCSQGTELLNDFTRRVKNY